MDAKRASTALAMLAMCAGQALAGRTLLSETVPVVAPWKANAGEISVKTAEVKEVKRDDKAIIDMICGWGEQGISSRSIDEDILLSNLTDPSVAERVAQMHSTFPWALPRTEDMEYLCKMMREFYEEREQALAEGKPYELIFYGDTILQSYRFEGVGTEGSSQVAEQFWGDWRMANWALGSDTVSNLMWRILNGNGPDRDTTKVIVLQVGQQDILQAPQNPSEWEAQMDKIANQIIEVANYLVANTEEAQVLIVSQLAAQGYDAEGNVIEDREPALYKEGIEYINARLADFSRPNPRTSYINCRDDYVDGGKDGMSIDENDWADNLPTTRGFRKLAKCIDPFVHQFMKYGGW